jgi:lipopolysaccharide biosynthesis protein
MTLNKIAICLWIYNTKLWDEFLYLLKPLAPYIKVYIGLCKDNSSIINSNIINSLVASNIEHKEYFFPNHGADITSFIYQLNDIEEEIFIKLHTKKSNLGSYAQINWRAVHLHSLICDNNQIIENQKLLNNTVGLLCNKHFIFHDQEYTNKEHIYILCNLLDIPYEKLKRKSFSAGTMFMSRTEIFKKYILPYTDQINSMLSQEQK